MKILHLHDAPHILGGATVYLRQLLAAMRARGHEQAVFSLDEPAQEPDVASACFVYEWPRSALQRRRDFGGLHAPLARALEDFVRREAPAVVHVHNLAAFRSTVFPTLARLGVPVLMTVHDYTLADPDPPGRVRTGPTAPLRRALDRAQVRRGQAALLAGVGRFLFPTRTLLEAVPAAAGRARLLRLPIALAEAAPAPPPPLRLFFAGTLYRSKGVDLLLDALARGRGPAATAELEIAGGGDQEAVLRAQAEQLGLGSRVRFLGVCGPDAMEAAYARAAVQVLPSRVKENSPLTVLEAGARGRPAVAPHAGGVPELLEPPLRGWTFESGDAGSLARALGEAADPAEAARRGAAMRAWVRAECDPGAHWDAVDAEYRGLAR